MRTQLLTYLLLQLLFIVSTLCILNTYLFNLSMLLLCLTATKFLCNYNNLQFMIYFFWVS